MIQETKMFRINCDGPECPREAEVTATTKDAVVSALDHVWIFIDEKSYCSTQCQFAQHLPPIIRQ
jgi:hypothetical protein